MELRRRGFGTSKVLEGLRRELNAKTPAIKELVRGHPRFERILRAIKRPLSPPGAQAASVIEAHPRFVAALKRRYGIEDVRADCDPLARLHLDYALSTLSRGEAVRETVAGHRAISGARYLDVGCAYGGFLVAMRRAGAEEVVGLDVNPELLDCARALLRDCGIEAKLLQLDIVRPRPAEALGQFDIITANDVLEHVADPAVALGNLVSLLRPGGLLYLEVPNRLYVPYMRSDPHFQLLGIAALPKSAADRYYREVFGAEHDVTYKSLPFYVGRLSRLGVDVALVSAPPQDRESALEQVGKQFRDLVEASAVPVAKISPDLLEQTRRHLRRAAGFFARQKGVYARTKRRNPAKALALADRLLLMFGVETWRLVVRRPLTEVSACGYVGGDEQGAAGAVRDALTGSAQ